MCAAFAILLFITGAHMPTQHNTTLAKCMPACTSGIEYVAGVIADSEALVAEACVCVCVCFCASTCLHNDRPHLSWPLMQATHMLLDAGGIALALIAVCLASLTPSAQATMG